MRIDWIYDGCDAHDVPEIERYWEGLQFNLDGKLAELSDAPSELRLAVERGESNPQWEIHAALHLPGRTLVSEGQGQQVQQALDQVVHGLAAEIDRLEDTPVRFARRRKGLEGVDRLLKMWRDENRSAAFLSFLAPVVRSLGSYVQRELKVRELDGTLIGEEIDTSDVLDDVLVQAWEKYAQRGAQTPLDLWLIRLADEGIQRLGQQLAATSIDEETLAQFDEPSSEREAWIEQVSYPETIEISELLPSGPGVDSWDDLGLETKQAHLAEMLGKLDRDQRQAFALNVAHGYDVGEIADFQSRSSEQVEADIAQAIATIRRHFIDEQLPDPEEPFADAEIRHRQRRKR